MLWYTVHTSVLMTAQYSTEQFCKSLPPPPPPLSSRQLSQLACLLHGRQLAVMAKCAGDMLTIHVTRVLMKPSVIAPDG